jgi:hypothetical protein
MSGDRERFGDAGLAHLDSSGDPTSIRGAVRDALVAAGYCIPPPGAAFTPDPALLAWEGGTVRVLARSILAERSFEYLLVLADALEDGGCTDPEALGHCRGPGGAFERLLGAGPHPRPRPAWVIPQPPQAQINGRCRLTCCSRG